MHRLPVIVRLLPLALMHAWWNAWCDLWAWIYDQIDPVADYDDNFGDHHLSPNAEVGGGD